MRRKNSYIIGIDEVGRGSLAGPVVVAAVVIPRKFAFGKDAPKGRFRDSKKLSPARREAWNRYLINHPRIIYAIGRVYPQTVDRINISKAANVAAYRAYKRVVGSKLRVGARSVYLDGGLYLGNSVRRGGIARTIIKGDEKVTAIMAASVIAKVYRDRLMCRLAKAYPAYGFEIHKGYGTKAHFAALRRYGPSVMHRRTFLA